MKRSGFTLIELLVVIAIIGVLLALLLPALQKAREAANRARCQSHLKQIALAAHAYHGAFDCLPPGATSDTFQCSLLVFLLPFLEQQNRYRLFDQSQNAHEAPVNAPARAGDVPLYLCPSDPSSGYYQDQFPPLDQAGAITGRANYFGNLGAHAWYREGQGSVHKPPELVGVFACDSRTRLLDMSDGTSNTALFAEVKRGAAPDNDALNVTLIPLLTWGVNLQNNPNNISPPAACDSPVNSLNLTGLQFYRGFFTMNFYTHTVPPNYTGRDCLATSFDRGHLAARSYHPGGVNVALADGSVRFIRDTISLATWKKLGTRSGGEVIDAGDF
jgi:prepilin-type N-terminal cleavage/methylation domain-containing protein/prepilin-type processing-associated H-X9-DG protein